MAIFDEIQVRVYRSYVKIPLIFFVPALTLLSLFSLAYFHTNSPHFWRAVEGQLHDQLGGEFSLDYLQMGPTLTTVEIYNAEIATADGDPVIQAQRVDARLNPLMLFTGRVEFSRGVADGADVRLRFDDDGKLNLLKALGLYERFESTDPDDDRVAVGFSDITVKNGEFEFVDKRFGFTVDEVDIPDAEVFVEPATVLMSVDELSLPRADFWFHPELFRFSPERGDWEFTVRDFEVDNWQWVNEGFTVDRVAADVEGIALEAGGRMAFPSRDGQRQMQYDAEGTVEAVYHSSALEYFTDGDIRFDIPRLDAEVTGDFDEIHGHFDVHARALMAQGVWFENLRGEVEMNNRNLTAERVDGSFYGGELRAENAFFNLLDTRFGADVFFDGVDPRPMIDDMIDADQPFLEGSMDGGLRIIGEIPTTARPGTHYGYGLAHDAMARFAQMEVIEPTTLTRGHQRMFPNRRIELQPGTEFWVDQRRLGLPTATAVSGDDRFEVRDFYMEYDTLHFERYGGSGPATVRADIAEIAPYATYYGLDGLEGAADFAMSFAGGFFGSPTWRLEAHMDQPRWRTERDQLLDGERIDLELAAQNGVIDIERAVAETEFGDYRAEGTVSWFQPAPPVNAAPPWPIWEDRIHQPLQLEVTADDMELAVVGPLIDDELRGEGPVDARLDLGGTLQALSGDFRVDFAQGELRGQPVRRMAFDGSFEPDGVRVDELAADLGPAGRFSGHGQLGSDDDFSFELEGDGIELGQLRPLDELPLAVTGATEFYLSGEGNVDEPVFTGGGSTRNLTVGGQQFGDVAVAADTVDDIVYLSGALLPWMTATVEIPLEGPAPYFARFGMEQLELIEFLPGLADHPMLDDATVSGTTQVYFDRDFSRHQIIFSLTELDVVSRGQRIRNMGPVIVGYNDGALLNIRRASFESGGRYFSLEGGVGLEQMLLDVRVEGDLDLGLLDSARAGFPDFFPEDFVDARGYANTDLVVRGTPENFVADGTVAFGPSEWEFRFLPEPIAIDSGRMNFGDFGIEIPEREPLEGTVLGGATRVAGTMGYLDDDARQMDLDVWSHNMSYRIPELATLAFDTNLNLTAEDWQDWESWLITGDVDVLDGTYRQEFNIVERQLAGRVIGAFQPQTDQYEAGLFDAAPMLEDIEFDLQARARDGFRVETKLDRLEMDLEFRFDVLIRDTLANPRVNGDFDVIDGHVAFQGEAFDVRSGTISFDGDLTNPHLDIQAGADVRNTCEESEFANEVSSAMTLSSNIDTAELQRYHIMMNLHGSLENLDLQMESNPYADQRDILSLLLTGCTVDQLTASGASRPTLEVALGPLLGRLEREIQGVVAVDEFTITPGVERTQVRIGDELTRRLSWRFHLDAGFTDATGGQKYQLEYKLSDRWSAELSERSHQETDDFLIDLKLNYRLPLD